MKILQFRTFNGPNVYHRKPILLARLDLEDLAETASNEIPGFTENLLELLPGLETHRCSIGERGGFVQRLHRGTYFAHIIEHIALELSTSAGIEVGFGKSTYAGAPGIYNVMVRFKVEEAMKSLLETALELAETLARGKKFDQLAVRLDRARELVADFGLGPSTRAIVDAAEKRGIPWMRLNEQNLIQFGYGSRRKLVQAAVSSHTSNIAVEIAGDKDLTKLMLARASIRVPRGRVVYTPDEAIRAFHDLGVPVAIKPLDGNQGKGVSLGIRADDQVLRAFQSALAHSEAILVEELFVGNDYRILIVGGKLVAASQRTPAHVFGDGMRTIAELIEIENKNPARGEGHEKPMTKIRVDEIALTFLKENGLDLQSVPAPGQTVFLRGTANLSTGGSARDVTEEVHPRTRTICERAARIIGLDICGIDFVIADIAQPPENQRGGIIEVNAGPGLRMHHYPSEGKSRDAGSAIINMLYPQGGESSRIPVISITGTNGKTTVTRMIAHIISTNGNVVGMTSSDGIYVNGELITRGDTTGPISAQSVLCDPLVEVAVLETARGGIVRRGLGYDWAEVAVMTNISPDHIGQDGIESVDDLVRIKSLVAERVYEGGALVLNADDEHLRRIAGNPNIATDDITLIYFSLHADQPALRDARAQGKKGYFLRDGWLYEGNGPDERQLIEAATIPATFGGTADFQIANALAAIAACAAYGISAEQAATSLLTFRPNSENIGRANVYKVRGGYAIIDYGHNPGAFAAIAKMTAKWNVAKTTGVIAVPGDRADAVLADCAKVAAQGFNKIIIREDIDLRGRAPGEAALLLCKAIHEVRPDIVCDIELDERKAMSRALSEISENEVVALFYDDLEIVSEILREQNAQPEPELAEAIGVSASQDQQVAANP